MKWNNFEFYTISQCEYKYFNHNIKEIRKEKITFLVKEKLLMSSSQCII